MFLSSSSSFKKVSTWNILGKTPNLHIWSNYKFMTAYLALKLLWQPLLLLVLSCIVRKSEIHLSKWVANLVCIQETEKIIQPKWESLVNISKTTNEFGERESDKDKEKAIGEVKVLLDYIDAFLVTESSSPNDPLPIFWLQTQKEKNYTQILRYLLCVLPYQ